MSVLLDALKKAAEEKKKARDDVAIDSASIIALDETSSQNEQHRKKSDDARADLANISADEPSRQSLSFVLESTHPALDPESLVPPELVSNSLSENISSTDKIKSSSADLSVNTVDHDKTSSIPEDTINPILMNAASNVKGFDTSLGVPETSDAHNSILMEGALSENTQKSANKKGSPTLIIVLVVILFLMGIGFYGLMYYQVQNDALERSLRQYELAKTLPLSSTPASNVAVQGKNRTLSATLEPTSNSTIGHDSTSALLVDKVASGSQLISENSALEKSPVMHSAASKIDKTATISSKYPIRSDVYPKIKPQRVPLKTSIVVDNESRFLSLAYTAYNQADLQQARYYFEKVLNLNQQNMTALIGLGGVAISDNNPSVALDFYHKALEIQPESLDVFEAIGDLSGVVELNSDWKKSLIRMIDLYPDSATLHYALGNVYSAENDWLAAQTAYFNALSNDEHNPDYLINLAVSLDQLGKYGLASKYYTQALALSSTQAYNFDLVQVKNRLVSIQQFIQMGHR